MNLQDINKAAITSADFGAAVSLSYEESDRFIDYVVDQSFLKGNARVEKMTKATKKINKVGIGTRILKPATAGIDPGNTVGMSTSQITLAAKEMIAIAEISDDSLEDNQEGDAFVDHLMKMISKQVANELEIAYTYGRAVTDLATAVTVDQLFNGWATIAQSNGHVVSAGAPFADRYMAGDKLSRLMKSLPLQYRADRSALRFLLGPDLVQDYVDTLGARYTSLGDAANQGLIDVKYGNVPLTPVNLMPTNRPMVSGTGVSTVNGNTAVGAVTVTLVDATGYAIGDYIAVGYGTAKEEVRLITNVAVNAITVEALIYAHVTGEVCKEVTPDACDIVLTDYRNLIVGIHRDIRVETQRNARTRSTSFVLTLRTDVQVENPDAMSIMNSLKVK